MKSSAIAYWLIPAEPTRQFLARIIGQLAARFDAPIFDPHLTVFVAPANARAPSDVVRETGPVRTALTAKGIHYSEQFTKTLFVRFEKSAALQELGDAIWKRSGAGERRVIDPHVSLLYQDLPELTKRELAESIQLPFHEVVFDSVRAMRCPSPTQTAHDVCAWETLASQNSTTR